MKTRIEEIKKQITEIEDRQWWLSMADKWTQEDRDLNRKYTNEIIRLKRELNELTK